MRKASFGGALAVALVAVAGMGLPGGAAQAQSVEQFYKGKTVRILVGFGPGTNYDIYARAIAQHMPQHVPGQPAMIVQNMPGAAGLTMMNAMYNVTPKDGSVFGLPVPNLLFEPLYDVPEAQFDARKFSWIGSLSTDPIPLCLTWHTSPTKTIEDAKKRETIMAATAKNSTSYFQPAMLNAMIGTKYKIVLGYPDSGAIAVAMERGEAEGYCGFSYATLITSAPHLLEKKLVNIQLQLLLKRDPLLPDTPSLQDVIQNEGQREVFELVRGYAPMNRPIFAPPDMPADRLEALRKAFLDTMKDPAYLAEAARLKLDVDPLDGAGVDVIVKRLYASPKSVIDKVKAFKD